MLIMLQVLFVNNDLQHPVKCVSDKAYGWTQHLQHLHTRLGLRLMADVEQAVAEEEDA